MEAGRPTYRRRIPTLVVLALAVLSCGRTSPRSVMIDNQPPEITLDEPSFGPNGVTFTWHGYDPDGRVDHYVYAVNPDSLGHVDTSWIATSQTQTTVPRSDTVVIDANWPQIFAVAAVDNRGAESAIAWLAVSDTAVVDSGIAPRVFIDSPAPQNPAFTPIFPPSFEIRWHGQDLDGRIVKYKFQLFTSTLDLTDFSDWNEVDASVTSTTYTDLELDQIYTFAITAVDDDGNYDRVFTPARNLLRFAVSNAGGPTLCVQSALFNYCAASAGDLRLLYEIPANPLQVSWFATPGGGTQVTGYRWTVDPADTTHLDQNSWSPWSLSNTSGTLGPWAPGSQHALYVQARDGAGFVSTLRLGFYVVGATFSRDLLIVDDTRLRPDMRNPDGTLAPPIGAWPTASELDTFLYARGGKPWQGYPAGTLSSPGILSGYDFDTLNTRGIPSGIVPLSVISQYRQVMWFVDDAGATNIGDPIEVSEPITSLRFMSMPGQLNTLSAYVAQGGKLWISGGGSALATLAPWSRPETPDDWTNADQELIPGRFMYDFPHWRSAVAVRPARQALLNAPDWASWPNAAPGRGWSAHGPDHNLNQPDYGKLAAIQTLLPRTCATDPPPPQRFCNSFYLLTSYVAEFMGRVPPNASPPNFVHEDADPDPDNTRLESTLDTLYSAVGGSMPEQLPVMTYYHGFESGPVVFSGLPIWYFQRVQCQALVDFVLQDIWGLTKQTAASRTATASRRR